MINPVGVDHGRLLLKKSVLRLQTCTGTGPWNVRRDMFYSQELYHITTCYPLTTDICWNCIQHRQRKRTPMDNYGWLRSRVSLRAIGMNPASRTDVVVIYVQYRHTIAVSYTKLACRSVIQRQSLRLQKGTCLPAHSLAYPTSSVLAGPVSLSCGNAQKFLE